jgi:hypothetical protein
MWSTQEMRVQVLRVGLAQMKSTWVRISQMKRVHLAPQLLLIQITPLLKKILNHQVMMGDLLKGEG